MQQHSLFDTPLPFGGKTYDAKRDGKRLGRQLQAVRDYLLAHDWVTLPELREKIGGSDSALSARLRDLRKPEFGGFNVQSECVERGLWRYRIARETA